MNNNWNRLIYKIWSPIYDSIFNRGPFLKARKTIFSNIHFQSGDKILFVGVGTGADIEQLPFQELNITAIDYSYDMLHKAKQKFVGSPISFFQMDAQQLTFPDETFDYVIGSLILSVVPDGRLALKEMVRVSKKGGHVLIFDKFASLRKSNSIRIKIMRNIIKLLGTDIGRSFDELYKDSMDNSTVISDEDIMFKGMYRKIFIQKKKIH
jgi:phosphatidylethanolamine/phosphatidyl-N-methylethanolamine N-methyltransferase